MLWNEFHGRANAFGNRVAVATPDSRATFSEIFSAAENLAGQLSGSRVRAGDAVGLCLPNTIDFVVAYLALCRLRCVVLLVSTKYHATELQAITAGTRPDFFLTGNLLSDSLVASVAPVKRKQVFSGATREPLVLIEREDRVGEKGAHWWRKPIESKEQAPSLIKFTSGSTGEPKGIVLSASNLLAETRNVGEGLALTPDDCILSAVPAFHSYGFDLGVLASLHSGARLELRDTFIPRKTMGELARPEISVFLGVPSMYRFFLETRMGEIPNLSHIRYLLSCTAPLSPETINAFHQKFGAVICQHYGSSESGAATTHVPSEVLNRKDSVGQAMPNVRIRIVDPDGHATAAGSAGEVVISGAAVALGYAMGQPGGGSGLKNGEYWTGDVGYLDSDGFLYVTGRLDRLINVGGMKVSPDEVVRVLESCPVVREAAVIGARDQSGEEIVYAAVTLKSEAGENDILAWCRGRLADYKIPRRVDIRSELPRGATGKVRLRPEDVTI
ncbi:MAG: class I adenylate-forming enzyme family protein [Candidatus Zixiibacteriota bacterium]